MFGVSALTPILGLSFCLTVCGFGCSSGGAGGSGATSGWPKLSGSPAEAEGFVRDLDPAVRRAATEHELAVTRILEPRPGTRYYELRGIRSESAWLEVEWADESAVWDDIVDASMRMKIGTVGDPDREQAFMKSVREELANIREGK